MSSVRQTLSTYTYGKESFSSFQDGIQKEWVLTNGLGSYSGTSIIGAHTRKHHGLMIASLHSPTRRYQILSKIKESLILQDKIPLNTSALRNDSKDSFFEFGKTFSFDATQKKNHTLFEGQRYLSFFRWQGVPTYFYQVSGFQLSKTISYVYGKNTLAISYEIQNGSHNASLQFTPLFNYRDHNAGSRKEDLNFSYTYDDHTITLSPKEAPDRKIFFYFSDGSVSVNSDCYEENIELQTEIDTGMSSEDTSFCPISITVTLKPFEKKRISMICSLETEYEKDASIIIQNERLRKINCIEKAGYQDRFANDLVVASDQFLALRKSTGLCTVLAGLPWFTDWGRDTMIALHGLCLSTKRYEDARNILKTFSLYIQNGLVPNMFPDEGLDPLYNTADASLWYFYAIDRYLAHTGQESDYEFVKEHLFPGLLHIFEAYKTGTLFSIYMDHDYLIHAGSNFDQVTWMDVRSGDWVPTPRHGKPVEINALWYNALKVMENLALLFHYPHEEFRDLAEKTKESFQKKFWCDKTNCLKDVVDEEIDSAKLSIYGKPAKPVSNVTKQDNLQIRPNQIWAVSLPYTMLSREQEASIVHVVYEKLYADYGLRSLAYDDPEYHGRYFGELSDRDAAYHQGTIWAFPLGGFISAYTKVHDHSKESIQTALSLLQPIKDHLKNGCIGQIAEIFEGNYPHTSRGCYAQAWSVGEILRCYSEDILPYLSSK